MIPAIHEDRRAAPRVAEKVSNSEMIGRIVEAAGRRAGGLRAAAEGEAGGVADRTAAELRAGLMALEDNGFFSPGTWGFMEGWPRGSEAPVFDICHGENHVARLLKDGGEWRVVLRPTAQISTDLASLLHVLDMVGRRISAFETQGGEQSVGSRSALKEAQAREAPVEGGGLALSQMIGRALAATG
jgi:hypothetical protein